MRTVLLSVSAALALLPSSGAAQSSQARVTYYGDACSNYRTTAPAPFLSIQGLPQLGAQITVRYQGPNSDHFAGDSIPVLITGLSAVDLPVPRLTADMSTSCRLLVDPNVAVYFMPLGPQGTYRYLDSISYTIPQSPSLLGQSVFHQWATWIENCLGPCRLDLLMFSRAAEVQVGT